MATFIMLSTLGPNGMETLSRRPDRVMAVNSEVEAMGARVIAQYALLGEYDFLTVLEAPDEHTMAKVAVALGSRGTLKTRTLPAIPVEDFLSDVAALRESD